jgi:hypothetical protein
MSPEDPDEETTTNPGETLARASFQHRSGKDESGDLARVSLEDVLTNLFCSRSTGTLSVDAVGGEPAGELVIWKGDVLAAQSGATAGDEAVLAVLKRRQGTFKFTEDIEPREQNVKRSVPDLVAEAARRRGERRPGAR